MIVPIPSNDEVNGKNTIRCYRIIYMRERVGVRDPTIRWMQTSYHMVEDVRIQVKANKQKTLATASLTITQYSGIVGRTFE